MKKDFVMPILVLSLICLFVSSALAFSNSVTHPVIEEAADERALAVKREIMPLADDFELMDVEGLPKRIAEVYRTNDQGFIFMISTTGYGGEIKILCGIAPDGTLIKSVVLSHTETQGFGPRVFDNARQYEGMSLIHIDGIDAVSGATISFKAYHSGIREAFEAFELVKGVRP